MIFGFKDVQIAKVNPDGTYTVIPLPSVVEISVNVSGESVSIPVFKPIHFIVSYNPILAFRISLLTHLLSVN